MPNKKVTELPVATSVDPTDVLLVVQGGVTKQVSQDTVAASLSTTYPALRSTPPDHTVVVAYIDTSFVPPVLKGWNGSTWVALGATGSVLTNTVAPAITGQAYTGGTLTVSNGTWSATPDSYAYQWLSDGTPIMGATAQTYTVLSGDVGHAISARVTPAKSGYSVAPTLASAVTPTTTPTASHLLTQSGGRLLLQSSSYLLVA